MSGLETPLEMTQRHVAAAEQRLIRQELLISRMEIYGQDRLLPQARAFLQEMESFLRQCREHLDRELAKL